jgi:hypothetical protein
VIRRLLCPNWLWCRFSCMTWDAYIAHTKHCKGESRQPSPAVERPAPPKHDK